MPGKISYFKEGINQVRNALDVPVAHAISIIKSDKYKDQILQLRETANKEVRQSLKRDLGYFTFSGTFRKRNANEMIAHSELICIDFDDLDRTDPNDPDERDIRLVNEYKKVLSEDVHTLACFVSPSGNGLKLLVKINPEKHLESFKGLQQYYESTYQLQVDQSGKDVSRACYVSWDPDIYYNEASTTFTAIVEGDFKIDFDSGEVVQASENLDSMDEKTRKSYDRAVNVVEQIQKVQHDLTGDYQEWMEIGMALSTFGEPGRNLFHMVSQFNPGYKPGECDRKFDDFRKNSRFTSPAKFFKMAKDAGFQTRNVRQENPATAEGVKNSREWVFNMPDGVKADEEIKLKALDDEFIEYKNQIYLAKLRFKDKIVDFESASNYVVRPLFLIKSKSDPKRLYEIKNNFNEKTVVDLPAKAFVSFQSFCEIMEIQGNYLLQVGKVDFFKLKKKWYREEKTAEEIKVLGWHRHGFYAYANGIFHDKKFHPIDEYGMISKSSVDEEEKEITRHYFIPAMSEIYKDEEAEYETEKNFIYVNRNVTWAEWSDLFCKVHGDNGKVALLYYISCLFRDIIYARFKNFPHLMGFGPRGTGKSTLGWSLTYLFGKERKPFNLNSGTAPGFYRTFAQFNNAVTWFDEFSNKIDLKRQEDLKNAYDGAGHVKGDWSSGGNSNKTVTTPVKSGCYISGQELPITNPALFSRTILLDFTKSDFTQEEKDMASQLTDMETPGLSRITAGMTHFRDVVNEKFIDAYDRQLRKLKKHFEAQQVTMIERLIHNNAILLAVFEIMREVIDFPFSDKEIDEIVKQKLLKHSQLFSKSEETSQFWRTVQFLFDQGFIKDNFDFTVKYVNSVNLRVDRNRSAKQVFEQGKRLLFISLSRVHGLYQKSLREQGENKGMDRESLVHYLEHSRGYIGAVNKVNYGDRASSGYVFDYDVLESQGYNLEKGPMMGGDDIDENTDERKPPKAGGDDDDDTPF